MLQVSQFNMANSREMVALALLSHFQRQMKDRVVRFSLIQFTSKLAKLVNNPILYRIGIAGLYRPSMSQCIR